MSWSIAKAPLVYHALLETAAALSYALQPEAQLPGASDDTKAVLLNYSGLLVSTNVLAAAFAWRPGFDGATRLVVGSLAIYHVFPIFRARAKIQREAALRKGEKSKVLGGPQLHIIVHGLCLASLVSAAVYG
ncbi:hypothetical protein GQ53DRAFT_751903 [Thozetella sp. PMI_491]|nr:hypothetical protein GQ53DRAFT_751903 [Thozetella sp. PMI_491]